MSYHMILYNTWESIMDGSVWVALGLCVFFFVSSVLLLWDAVRHSGGDING